MTPETPPESDALADAIEELRRLEKAATPGPWERDTDGEHSPEGDLLQDFVMGPNGKSLFDTLNAADKEIHHEPDDDGIYYFDPIGRANLDFIVAARNALTDLLAALESERARRVAAEAERDEARTEVHFSLARIGNLLDKPMAEAVTTNLCDLLDELCPKFIDAVAPTDPVPPSAGERET